MSLELLVNLTVMGTGSGCFITELFSLNSCRLRMHYN